MESKKNLHSRTFNSHTDIRWNHNVDRWSELIDAQRNTIRFNNNNNAHSVASHNAGKKFR